MIRVGPDFEKEYPGASGLATECYANLVRTGDLLIGLHNRQASDEFNLSASAKQALAVIEGAGEPLEPRVIAERLIITTGSVTSLLDTLERRGLIVRKPHPEDRRRLLINVTPAAVELLNTLLPSLHQRERSIVSAALSEAEQNRLLELLAKVQRAATEHADAEPDRTARRVPPTRLAGG
jgi:DNA-binding MarR family transcriptional regulator